MANLKVLNDDHALLGSRVTRVMTLLKDFAEGQSDIANLKLEVLRHVDMLQNQLAEHFALEEVMAFPRLEEEHPELAVRLEALLVQHDYILDAFEQFYAVLSESPSTENRAEALARGIIFKKAFEQHAAAESALLNELGSVALAESGA